MNNAVAIVPDTLTKFGKPRIWELDFLRGISILLMCADHLFYDVYYLFGANWSRSSSPFLLSFYDASRFYFGYHEKSILFSGGVMAYAEFVFLWFILAAVTLSFVVRAIQKKGVFNKQETKNYISAFVSVALCIAGISLVHTAFGYKLLDGTSLREFIHVVILWVFFVLCGEGCYFSKSNFKRAFLIGLCAAAISAVTILGEEVLDIQGIAVRYGVLHMLATAVFIFAVIQWICRLLIKDEEKRKYVISAVCFILGVITYGLNQGLWGVETLTKTDALAWFHYAFAENFRSSDWFTLSENLHRVLFGAAIAPFVYPDRKSYIPALTPLNRGVVCFLGRKTLWIVLAHQIIIYLFLTLLSGIATA